MTVDEQVDVAATKSASPVSIRRKAQMQYRLSNLPFSSVLSGYGNPRHGPRYGRGMATAVTWSIW